ncbi:phosphoglycerate mutase-like protein [Dacryopinax primogenitus]|uniref:Phosphoglycerate mutase-like protein n=1 Tax=Dacryopinax primogenitus (strain DJM 731) TaxID=1858805 RepID=M5FV70_DACPD|nr:phosphoglycerate mutase-like protein [Dacryopinax primogenitus]EJU01676.1 phosphoglycerate mutase-like protein [Dacryopinax primogenitus]
MQAEDYQPERVVFRPAAPYAGSTLAPARPIIHPSNAITSLFPAKNGPAGPTPTGAEAGMIQTASSYPMKDHPDILMGPKPASDDFDIFKHWGNLSPWYSVPSFGLDSSPLVPDGCRVTMLNILHRHGARYPTSSGEGVGPAGFATRLHNALTSGKTWSAGGDLDFLNDWVWMLGADVLTPFGREQMYKLGVDLRIKYGFLLNNFTVSQTLPVFRTESQDRMRSSSENFALGFFGERAKDQYLASITVEASGFNNTLSPYYTCHNSFDWNKSYRQTPYMKIWLPTYLKDTLPRIQSMLEGFELSYDDIFTMQTICAYETVALGYSAFCGLFTQEEWEGFEYAWDIYFWYDSGWGSPVARGLGLGYVKELVARLTNTPIAVHDSTTNSTLDDNPITFPLGSSLYVDATHETVVLNILTALNLSSFAAAGPPPADHIPEKRSFIASQVVPFGTNVQFQVLSCAATPDPQIRIILNDGVVPLEGLGDCPYQQDGMCAVHTFVAAEQKILHEHDWSWSCTGNWTIPPGMDWQTTTGDCPPRHA